MILFINFFVNDFKRKNQSKQWWKNKAQLKYQEKKKKTKLINPSNTNSVEHKTSKNKLNHSYPNIK